MGVSRTHLAAVLVAIIVGAGSGVYAQSGSGSGGSGASASGSGSGGAGGVSTGAGASTGIGAGATTPGSTGFGTAPGATGFGPAPGATGGGTAPGATGGGTPPGATGFGPSTRSDFGSRGSSTAEQRRFGQQGMGQRSDNSFQQDLNSQSGFGQSGFDPTAQSPSFSGRRPFSNDAIPGANNGSPVATDQSGVQRPPEFSPATGSQNQSPAARTFTRDAGGFDSFETGPQQQTGSAPFGNQASPENGFVGRSSPSVSDQLNDFGQRSRFSNQFESPLNEGSNRFNTNGFNSSGFDGGARSQQFVPGLENPGVQPPSGGPMELYSRPQQQQQAQQQQLQPQQSRQQPQPQQQQQRAPQQGAQPRELQEGSPFTPQEPYGGYFRL